MRIPSALESLGQSSRQVGRSADELLGAGDARRFCFAFAVRRFSAATRMRRKNKAAEKRRTQNEPHLDIQAQVAWGDGSEKLIALDRSAD